MVVSNFTRLAPTQRRQYFADPQREGMQLQTFSSTVLGGGSTGRLGKMVLGLGGMLAALGAAAAVTDFAWCNVRNPIILI